MPEGQSFTQYQGIGPAQPPKQEIYQDDKDRQIEEMRKRLKEKDHVVEKHEKDAEMWHKASTMNQEAYVRSQAKIQSQEKDITKLLIEMDDKNRRLTTLTEEKVHAQRANKTLLQMETDIAHLRMALGESLFVKILDEDIIEEDMVIMRRVIGAYYL